MLRVLTFLCLFAVASPALAESPNERAREHHRLAAAAIENGKLEQAAEHFEAALALQPSFDVALSLADVEQKLGRDARAANHLAQAIADFPPSAPNRIAVQDRLADLEGRLGKLVISTDPAECAVTVDGASLRAGQSTVYVDPGEHAVQLSAPGYVSQQRAVTAASGEETKLRAVLAIATNSGAESTKPPATVAVISPTPVDSTSSALSPRQWALVGGGAGVVAGVVTTLIFAGQKSSLADKGDELRSQVDNCSGSSDAQCAELADNAYDEEQARWHTIVAASATGLVAVGTVGLYFLLPNGESVSVSAGPLSIRTQVTF
jgi:tetratricopeptide (TPR) repeat protein